MITYISNLILPILVLLIICYGLKKKVSIYDVFIEGAKESFELVLTMFPCFLAMIFGINIFLKSNVIGFILDNLEPLFMYLKIPKEIFPMIIMRPISGSSTLVILNTIFEKYGPDSLIGNMASIIQGSTDTTFYILTLYFGSIGIKKIRYALYVGLFADLVGILSAIIIANLVC
ncbi:MAG: spore maturation protein [Bacilli bacterium]